MKSSLIVHPVSYSPSGKTALATAIELARISGADLHVLELTGRRRSSNPIVRPINDANVEPHFAEFVRSVYSADVKISAVELVGDVVDAVADYARSASADLVVVADQARSHGPYWRRGMYANDLARHLSVPLVSVPVSRDVALAREGASADMAKSRADAIARIIGSNAVAKASANVESETFARPGTLGESTLRAPGEVRADLVVVARPGRAHHVSMNSELARVLRDASRPVLVLPSLAADSIRTPLPADSSVSEMALSR
jgi:nucleotide-binding universal stress UspA family protein